MNGDGELRATDASGALTVPPPRTVREVVPAFRPGGEFTVGVEEELLVLDRRGALLGATPAGMGPLPMALPSAGVVTGEVFLDQVELNSPPGASGDDIAASLRRLRAWVAARGARTVAVGVHPSAPLGAARTASSARYDGIVAEFAGLLRTPTAALQVHVGLPDTVAAIRAYRGLRNRLSLLRALAATSPYWHGVDSGLASSRSAIVRSYPRVGPPPPLASWEEYVTRTESLVALAEVPDHTYVWWDVRPQPNLGTLEVRVMDAQPSVARVAGLTTLVQGIARRAVEAPDPVDLDEEVVVANDHRACRHGLDTRVVDVDGTSRPLREVAARVVAEARAVLADDGLERPLDAVEQMMAEPPEPARQRHLHDTGGMGALLTDLTRRTADLHG